MWTSRYVARSSGARAFYSIFVHRLALLLGASFRPHLAATALAPSLALHLHQVGQRTFTSELLSMPSTHRDRGEPRGSAPPTPPGIRVRTTAVREVALTRVEQGRETERFEVGIGEPHRERFAPGKVPRATAAAGHIA